MAAKIMVIEDNQANLDLMTYLLEAFGHSVLTAVNGEDGVAAVYRERPDLIVCDIHLPKLDGCEVARRIKKDQILCKIPLIAVTAFAMVGDRDRILTAGFDGYIAKPIVPETFVDQIDAFLAPNQRTSRPKPQGEAPAIAAASTPKAPARRGHILLVDDSPTNLSVMQSVLELSGYTVSAATRVVDILPLARKVKPKLIVSDLHMPAGSGYDLIRSALTNPELKDIPVAIITSTDIGEAERRKATELGATRFIVRPIEPQDFLREIESCLARRG